jgi:hypothetical protein
MDGPDIDVINLAQAQLRINGIAITRDSQQSMGSDLTDEGLGKSTSGFFSLQKNRLCIGFWRTPLLFEETIKKSWLFHSTPGMNADTIQDEIFVIAVSKRCYAGR